MGLTFRLVLLVFYLCFTGAVHNSRGNGQTFRDRINTQKSQAKDLRVENNEDIPVQCRTDLCIGHTTSNPVKGWLEWPWLQVGYELEQDCPWTQFVKVKIKRRCNLDNNGTLVWSSLDYEQCPDPPIKFQLRRLKEQVNSSDADYLNVTQLWLSTLHSVYQDFYHYTPVDLEDRKQTLEYLISVLTTHVQHNKTMSRSSVRELLQILDILLLEDRQLSVVLRSFPEIAHRLFNGLHSLPQWIDMGDTEYNFTITGSRLFLHVQNSAGYSNNGFSMNVTNSFWNRDSWYNLHNFSIDISPSQTKGNRQGGVVIIKHMEILEGVATFINTSPFDPQKTHPQVNETMNSTIIAKPHHKQRHGKLSAMRPKDKPGTMYPRGPLLMVSAQRNNDLHLTYTITGFGIWDSETICASANKGHPLFWTNGSCQSIRTVKTLTCRCKGAISHGVFSDFQSDITVPTVPTPTPDLTRVPVISSFLGFPYYSELALFGKIGDALSMCGLTITIISYLTISKASRGTPSWILVNLSLSLLLLIAFIFSVELFSQSPHGCSVANSIRYYLVFVSILWNGIEGFNMYLMLVRVFNSGMSHLKQKYVAVAWGVPILMVGVCLAVNYKAFHGQYLLLSIQEDGRGTCSLRCQLQTNTLLYGFVIPMCLVILQNLIVFFLVLKVIWKLGEEGSITPAKKKSKMSQLLGALAVLVLLGVPWLFSAFGVVDANTNTHLTRLEKVIQLVFVFCISLQGLFIFLFHCLRNTDIRNGWKVHFFKPIYSSMRSRISQTNSSQNTLR